MFQNTALEEKPNQRVNLRKGEPRLVHLDPCGKRARPSRGGEGLGGAPPLPKRARDGGLIPSLDQVHAHLFGDLRRASA